MNRFEQGSSSLGRRIVFLLPIAAFVILFILFLGGVRSVSDATSEKQL